MKKKSEFPRLDQSRLTKLLNQHREIQKQTVLAEEDFRTVSIEKWHELLPSPARWSVFYELTYPQHLMFLLKWIGVLDGYLEAVKSDDPIGSVLTFIDTVEEIAIKPNEDPKDGIDETSAILSWIAMSKTLKSWMIHSKTLSKLNEEIGQGSFPALYKALQIDPAIISTPNASHLFSIGLLKRNKKRFLATIHNKMNSKLDRHNSSNQEMRFILTALAEVGDLDQYTQSDKYKLFCEELSIYASISQNEETKDEFTSLNKFIDRWKATAEIYEYKP